jgi:SAM-dependent methyltransferase
MRSTHIPIASVSLARMKPSFRVLVYRLCSQIIDPLKALRGVVALPWFFRQWRAYKRLPGAERLRLTDGYPQLHDRSTTTPFDPHYFYVSGWAMRRIVANRPTRHIDVGSHNLFANLLGATVPVTFLDYRPLEAKLDGLHCVGGSILSLPFADDSVESLSSLHVAEHIGLGRYGDPLDPLGTKKAAQEMVRVLADGGNLFFAVPVGRPRVCFNAHRVHAAEDIRYYFAKLELLEFSGVHDDGRFVEKAELSEFRDSEYACGMFWFRKHPCPTN